MEAPIGQSYGCCSLWSLDPISGPGTNTPVRTTISACKRERGFQGLGDAPERRRRAHRHRVEDATCYSGSISAAAAPRPEAGLGRRGSRTPGPAASGGGSSWGSSSASPSTFPSSAQQATASGRCFHQRDLVRSPTAPALRTAPVPAATTRETGRNGAGSRRARSNQPNHRRRNGNIALSTVRQSCSGG